MRLNRFIAQSLGISRRAADDLIAEKRVMVDGQPAHFGMAVESDKHSITVDGSAIEMQPNRYVVMFKPEGYVSSRSSQGEAPTLYELLPPEMNELKIVGRLDKDSKGLILLTNNGQLALTLTHPSQTKRKVYQIELDRDLTEVDADRVRAGITILDNFQSALVIKGSGNKWQVEMREGKNRQIRRTFGAAGYTVTSLLRTELGPLTLDDMQPGDFKEIDGKIFEKL